MQIIDGRPDRIVDGGRRCAQWTPDQGCPLHGEACGAAVSAATAGTVVVRINPAMFAQGIRYAKQFGGSYNPTDKTWTLPTHRNGVRNAALNAPRTYGLIPVA